MAVTRINNNQITSASAGNAFVGINASTKLQDFSITAGKIANNLVYGSDLTVSGNLVVNGQSTAIDTTITTIEDPVIVLASTQTGSPTVDIGFIGERGTSNNIAFVWDESSSEFVTAFTSTSETSTTIAITSYTNFHTKDANIGGNIVINGTTSLVSNVIGAANFTGNVTGGNLLTAGLVTATGNVTGGNVLTGGLISATGSITSSTNITGGNLLTGGNVSATGNITGGNIISGNAVIGNINVSGNITVNSLTSNTFVSATGNVVSGNVTTAGQVSATGTVTGGNISTAGTVTAASTVGGVITGSSTSVTGTQTAASTVGGVITGSSSSVTGTQTAASTVGGVITGSSTSVTGTQTAASTVGGVITGSSSSVTGTQTAASTVGGVITGSSASVSGNVTGGNVLTGGLISATGNLTAGNISTAGILTGASTVGGIITGTSVSVTGGVTAASVAGGVITGTSSSVTGTQTAASTVGGVITGSSSSVTGTQTAASTVGGVITGSSVSVTGNITGANVNTNNIVGTGITITSIGTLSLAPTGNITANNKNINSLADPVQEQDAATKIYVDTVAQGLDPKASVVFATAANIAPYTYNNGTSGVGATLTLTSVGNLVIDGNVTAIGERVLIKNEVGAFVNNTTQSAAFNGIYVVTTAGAPATAAVLTRSTDFDNGSPSGEIPGAFTFVEKGAVNADTGYVCTTNAPVTVGTTQIIWAQFSGAGSFTAGAGLSLTGTQFNVLTDGNANPTTGINGSNQVVVPAGAAFTTPNIGAATGTSLSATGTVTAASTVGGVITGSSASVTGGVTAASVAGGVITGSSTSVTGTQTAASTVGGVITGSSTSVTGTQTAASTVGGVITGSSTSVTGTQTAASTVGGVITGSSASVSGNVTGGNVLTSGLISSAGNVTGGNILSGGAGSFTGNVTAANFFGNISGNIDAAGANTQVQFNDTGDILGASAGFTFNKTANLLTVTGNVAGGNVTTAGQVSATGNVTGGNVLTGGLILATATITGGNLATGGTASATGNVIGGNVLTGGLISATATITGGNLATGGTASATGNVTGGNVLTGGLVSATGNVNGGNVISSALVRGATVSASGNVIGGNVTTGGLISATGNITGANLILTTGIIDGPAAGRVTINGSDIDTDFAVDGDTQANIFYVDAGTGTASFGNSTQTTGALVSFNANSSVLFPVGNTGQRPSGVTGMVRFNTTTNAIEVYDNSEWISVGVPVFTVIADEQFNGDGTTVAFTLGSTQTTVSCIVSINGVVQIPTLAYAVAGTDPTCVLTFTEAPATGDIIDVRQITTTTTVTAISNSSGNAVIEVAPTANDVLVTGDLLPTSNVTFDLGSPSARWKDGYFSGSSITLGNVVIKNVAGGNTVGFFGPDGTTPAPVAASSVDTTQIASGTSNMAIVSSGGNIRANVGGTTVMTISPGLVDIVGNLTVSGNATLSGNILGDRIQNGTTSIDIQTPSGNANITVGGTSNVVVFATTGAFVTGLASITGNIVTGGNILSTGSISLAGNITGVDISARNIDLTQFNLTCGNIINGGGNGTGNIGSATTRFNVVHARATSAQYADLAEKYTADAEYAPGTVVVFGGTDEITLCVADASPRIAGVISTNPSYRMNDGLQSTHTAMVALTGRVPTSVIGSVRKGDMMVSAGNGQARAESNPAVGTVIGKALADSEGNAVIEVVVGRV